MTKKILSLSILLGTLILATTAQARDSEYLLPIKEAMNTAAAQQKLDPSIRFVFADAPHAQVATRHGRYVTNKKTNALFKGDEEACRWVMLSALLSLQERAKTEGGNAVINIESYYKQNPMASRNKYECHAGALIAGVALRGDVVTLQ